MQPLTYDVIANTEKAEGPMKRLIRTNDDFNISTKKASAAIKTFVGDIAQARDATDAASIALSGFSRILGGSLAATGVVVAGKALIDAFKSVQTAVKESKDSINNAFESIGKTSKALGFDEATAQAKMLFTETDKLSKKIKEIEASPLKNFIAGIMGSTKEMKTLVAETEKQARTLQKSAIQRAASEISIENSLTEEYKIAREVNKKYQGLIDSARELGDTNLLNSLMQTAAAEAQKKIEEYREKQKKKAAEESAKMAQEDAANAYKFIEDELAQMYEKNKEEKRFEQEKQKRLEEAQKREEQLNDKRLNLLYKEVSLTEKVRSARERVVEAEGQMANILSEFGGTGRGAGQRPTSLQVGINKRIEQARMQERQRMTSEERGAIKSQLQAREMERRFYAGERPGQIPEISEYDVNRELERMRKEAAKQAEREPQREVGQARLDLSATEETLKAVKNNLKDTLEELKKYAHCV